MIHKTVVVKIVDYILQNLGSINSTGLYHGKAGLSLSLFVAARYLQDEQIEEKAFNLLQESLVIKCKESNFEIGIAGIGYVLFYLIENKYLDADFDEIFGEQHEKIIENFIDIEKDPIRLVNSLQVIYYFYKTVVLKGGTKQLQDIIKKIFEGLELFLTVQFNDFTDIHYINDKRAVLNIYETYLKLVNYSKYGHFSNSLLKDYAALYRKDRIVSLPGIGFYLNAIASKYGIREYDDVVEDNLKYGSKNICRSVLSLKNRIDLMNLSCDNNGSLDYYLLPDLQYPLKEDMIQNLLKITDKKSSLGYGYGLGRLLLFCADRQTEFL